jgi:hypothetical protein
MDKEKYLDEGMTKWKEEGAYNMQIMVNLKLNL